MITTKFEDLIQSALKQLSTLGFGEDTVQGYYSSYFKPIQNQYIEKGEIHYNQDIMDSLHGYFNKQYEKAIISRNTRNKRIRGLNILQEIYKTGTFKWKVYTSRIPIQIPVLFSNTISDYLLTKKLSDKMIHYEKNILERFVLHLLDRGIDNLSNISITSVRDFIQLIASDCPKSMDKVITTISMYLKYLYSQSFICSDFTSILIYPRVRDHHIHEAMDINDLKALIEVIDRNTAIGKRDFAIMSLAVTTGLRAGDIALLKLHDVDWKKTELFFTQGKTNQVLRLPLKKAVCNVLADYILNARPDTASDSIFIRSLAPYVGFKDGVSISCIFRRYLKKADIIHLPNDGNTFHGIRRMIGTQMVMNSVPITTVSQVLGHESIKATKQYVSLNIEGLKMCLLPMSTLSNKS